MSLGRTAVPRREYDRKDARRRGQQSRRAPGPRSAASFMHQLAQKYINVNICFYFCALRRNSPSDRQNVQAYFFVFFFIQFASNVWYMTFSVGRSLGVL